MNNLYEGDFCQKHPTNSEQEACDKAEHCVLYKVFGKIADAALRKKWFDKCEESKLLDVLRCRKIYTSSNKDDNLNNTFTEVIENNIEDDKQQKQIEIKTKDIDVFENDCERYSDDLPPMICTTSYGECPVEYRHDGILDYTFESRSKKRNFYIKFYKDQNLLDKSKKWTPTPFNCTPISIPYTVGISAGAVLFIGAILFFAYAILINLRDKREYERFLEMQKNAFVGFDESKPTIYKGTSSVKKRLSRMSFKK